MQAKSATTFAVLFGLALYSIAAISTRVEAHTGRGVSGTVVIAHGGDSLWNARVIDAAKAANTGGPVEVSFLMGPGAATARFQDAVARLEAKSVDEIVVVPMLVSSHSGHYDQIRYLAGDSVQLDEAMLHHLHMGGIERPTTRLPASGLPGHRAPARRQWTTRRKWLACSQIARSQ